MNLLNLILETDGGAVLAWIVGAPIVIGGYFLPSIIAYKRQHTYLPIIFGLNIFAFTGFFWLGSFIWAVWPSDKSIVDPLIGNVTGTGRRNAGDSVGAAKYGVLRGAVDEHEASKGVSSVTEVVDGVVETGKKAGAFISDAATNLLNSKKEESGVERLAQYHQLHKDGAISDEEYAKLKAKILDAE